MTHKKHTWHVVGSMNLPFSFANLPVEEARRRELVGSSVKWEVTSREKKPEHHFLKPHLHTPRCPSGYH